MVKIQYVQIHDMTYNTVVKLNYVMDFSSHLKHIVMVFSTKLMLTDLFHFEVPRDIACAVYQHEQSSDSATDVLKPNHVSDAPYIRIISPLQAHAFAACLWHVTILIPSVTERHAALKQAHSVFPHQGAGWLVWEGCAVNFHHWQETSITMATFRCSDLETKECLSSLICRNPP